MRQLFSILLSLLLVITLLPPLQAAANEEVPFDDYGVRSHNSEAYVQLFADEEWETFPEKTDVPLTKEWSINFSDIATPRKIEAITIEHNNKLIPVRPPSYNNSEIVKVKSVQRLLGGQNYTLKILLKNGKKYKMEFTTTKEGADIESNNTYQQASDIYVDETIQGTVAGTDTTDFYKIRLPQNGQLDINLKRLDTNTLSLYLHDENGSDGDLLAYKENQTSITLTRELKAGTYYIQVNGTGRYELATSFTPKVVDPAKALQEAQKAVDALPAPVDVMDKHAEAIKQATTLIATAKSVGADPLAIEKLEKTIAKLQDIVQPLEMTISVLNATTFEVRFNRAVDASVALFDVNNGATVKAVMFNANKTVAKVEMTGKLNNGTTDKEYTLTANGVASKPLPTTPPTVTVKPETLASIEILGNYANRISANKATIDYIVKNQYGEDITDTTIERPEATATTTVKDATVEVDEVAKGKVTITTTNTKEGDSVTLTLTYGKLPPVTKTVTLSTKAAVEGIKILGVYNKATDKFDDGSLKETTILEGLNAEEFYLMIEATDQYDEPILDLSILTTPSVLRLVQTDPTVVKFAATTELKEVEVATGGFAGKRIGLPLTGTPKLGNTEVTLTTANGEKASHIVVVAESTRTDEIELIVPVPFTEGKDQFIEIVAKDKEKKLIPDLDILTSPVSGISWIIDPQIQPEIKLDPSNNNKPSLFFKATDIKAGTLKITGQSSTMKIVTKTITVQEKIAPRTWEEKSPSLISKTIDIKQVNSAQTIDEAKVTIKDQYGNVMSSLPNDYRLVVAKSNPASKVLEVVDNIITPKALGTEEVTIAIYNGNIMVAGSDQKITLTVTDGTDYMAYKIEPIEILYDALYGGKTVQPIGIYDREVIVLGILENREEPLKYAVDEESTEYTFELSTSLKDKIEITTDGKIRVKEKFYYGNKTEVADKIKIKIKSSGEVIEQDIKISNVPPRVEKIKVSKTSLSFEPDKNSNPLFGFTQLVDVTNGVEIVATDQYGVESKKLSNHQFEFPDTTTIAGKLQFGSNDDGVIIKNNNSKDAQVTDLPSGASFNAVVVSDVVSSPSIKVTIQGDGYTPEADTANAELETQIGKITSGTIDKLTNGENVLTQARALVDEGFVVTIKSSSQPTIINLDGKVVQPKEQSTVNVTFTVTKGIYKKDISRAFTIEQAPIIVKQDLISKIAEATATSVDVAISTDGKNIEPDKKWTTQAEKTALDTAITAAQAVNSNTNASQSEVDEAVTALNTALSTYNTAKKDGKGPTGQIGTVTIKTAYKNAVDAVPAEFGFVLNDLTGSNVIMIANVKISNLTKEADIVKEFNLQSFDFVARVDGKRIILTQETPSAGNPPEVSVDEVEVTVTPVKEYVDSEDAIPAEFTFTVITALATTDILKIGSETFTGISDETSIADKITNESSFYEAEVESGNKIILKQRNAKSEGVPSIIVIGGNN